MKVNVAVNESSVLSLPNIADAFFHSHRYHLHHQHHVTSVLIPDWSEDIPQRTTWFIHVKTHNLLKYTHRSQSSLLTCISALWGIQLWHLIRQHDQIMQPGITERMLHLWFTIPLVCMYSCVALQAANYGLILIIMDFVCSQQSQSHCAHFTNHWKYDQLGKKIKST